MNSSIPVIILAGGLGTRFAEETDTKPKPMITIGEHPILWHLMQIYSKQGFRDFIIATGYKHEIIDSWIEHHNRTDSWGNSCNVKAFYTGSESLTGERIRKIINDHPAEKFFVTYGDGLANINLRKLLEFHTSINTVVTVTSVRPPARFGFIESKNGLVTNFGEKNQSDAGWINGGFFVMDRRVLDYIPITNVPFETEPVSKLVKDKQLSTYIHDGFWQPMDTLREKLILEEYVLTKNLVWMDIET